MADLTPQNSSFYWANQFIIALRREGVQHLIMSPGSRSTPLTLAAAAHPRLDQTVILDERSAAYTALGIGKSTGIPAALICTSGTAAANYYPAIIESRQAGVPLIALTADRPPHLRSIGANQAIDQLKIFGSYPVWFHEIGEPRSGENDLQRLRYAAHQAVYQSKTKRGPVHLNFPFRKPLEPDPSYFETIKRKNEATTFTAAHHSTSGVRITSEINGFKGSLHKGNQPIIIAGPEDPSYSLGEWIVELSDTFHIPILAEAGANLPSCDQVIPGFSGFLRSHMDTTAFKPDLIIRIGQSPATKTLLRYLEIHRDVLHYHFTRLGHAQNALLSTDYTLEGIPPSIKSRTERKDRDEWMKKWMEHANAHLDLISNLHENSNTLTDGQAVRNLLKQLPSSWALCLSNSFPVRDASLYGGKSLPSQLTYVNRGASGIDGVTSMSAGIVRGQHKPALLLTGDLAFLHDTNALLQASSLPYPLVIGIINNEGGSIFRMLPIAQHEDTFETYFETPQKVHIEFMGNTYQVNYQLIESREDLAEFSFGQLGDATGIHLIEFRTDPDASMDERRKLWEG